MLDEAYAAALKCLQPTPASGLQVSSCQGRGMRTLRALGGALAGSRRSPRMRRSLSGLQWRQCRASGVGGLGRLGACHNCGEVGHPKPWVPPPPGAQQLGVGRGQGEGGGRGRGGTPRACYVCENLAHVVSQCAKSRVVWAAAAVDPDSEDGEMRNVGALDFCAFEEWRAMTAE
jgi:hypothetical protein